MKTIQNYTPPTAEDLAALKEQLGYTGAQMAQLASVAGSNQWRKYTGGEKRRELNPHILFFIAARLALDETQTQQVLARMRQIGADFSFEESETA